MLLRFTESGQSAHTARIQQIKNFFVVDLQERCENAYMALLIILSNGFNLLKEFLNATLSDTVIDVAGVVVGHFTLISLHCERFTTASLTICKYGSMIAVHDSINEASHA